MLCTAELDGVLKHTKKVPTEKYAEPMTSAQEIGWYNTVLVRAHLFVLYGGSCFIFPDVHS